MGRDLVMLPLGWRSPLPLYRPGSVLQLIKTCDLIDTTYFPDRKLFHLKRQNKMGHEIRNICCTLGTESVVKCLFILFLHFPTRKGRHLLIFGGIKMVTKVKVVTNIFKHIQLQRQNVVTKIFEHSQLQSSCYQEAQK